MLRGIDVSSHQSEIDWGAVALEHAFCIIKATGGDRYVNPAYPRQLAGARAAGLVCGSYHYDGEPSVSGGTAEQEAAHFLAHADIQPGELVALDAEERVTRDPARYRRWIDLVEAATGARVLLYTFPSFVREIGVAAWEPVRDAPLWWAHYWTPERPEPWPVAPLPWGKIAIWQWSGGTAIPGIPNPTDANVTALTRAELVALGTPGAGDNAPQARQDAPGATEAVTAYIDASGAAHIDINFGGQALAVDGYVVQDAGVSVIGTEGALYDRSVTPAGFGDWRKR